MNAIVEGREFGNADYSMQKIQFVSIANRIPMKPMELICTQKNMMTQEVQYHNHYQHVMLIKNSKSIDDQQYQQEMLD
jgi:hypothetical protein